VDIWQSKDQSGNHPEATYKNARLEGVADRVEVKNGDARQLPFEDGTFDVVVSSLVLHNIHDTTERKKAIQEIVRVLKGGGVWPSSISGTRTSTSRSCARAACRRSQDRACISPCGLCAW
jgi:ubiquinone/menaquinone biosynthesis C-methylase UbiE